MHHVDRDTPWDEIWEAMEVLRFQGKIIYVGSSNFAGWHIAQAQETARTQRRFGLVSEQSIYNLATRHIELEVLRAARAYGLGVLAWSPLHRGMLTGVLQHKRAATRYQRDDLDRHRPALVRYEDLCREIGAPPAEVALAWLLTRPGLTAPVIGPSEVDHLTSAVRAVDLRLDDDVLERLDAIFPGRKPAPEQYAF